VHVDVGTVTELVTAATLAPSSHNTQPWLFLWDGRTIELRADRTRALPVNDPADRELTISCGAALWNLRVAADAAGFAPDVELTPRAGDPDLLATVTLTRRVDDHHGGLLAAIPLRRTSRTAFTPDPLPPAVVHRLTATARVHDVEFVTVRRGPPRDRLAELVGAGDRRQFADPRWRRELAAWLRSRRRGDGLPHAAVTASAARFVVSHLDLGARTGQRDERLARDAPLLAVLVTEGDGPRDWLAAGQALEHLLLVAADVGLAAGYLNQPCQVADLRDRLRASLEIDGHPQLVVRVGHPPTPLTPSPRRPVGDVLASAT
jgi:hypothetical protein